MRSDILPALLDACSAKQIPLHFVSWHTYTSSPDHVRSTIDYANGLLKAHPGLHPETVLDEWNMDLLNPPRDPRLQPCYVLETAWQMKVFDLLLQEALKHSLDRLPREVL